MIPGVELKQLTRHVMGERGYYFEEVIRASDPFFAEGFGQWSRTKMATGTIKAWHYHRLQVDWWYVESGLIKAVLVDVRNTDLFVSRDDSAFAKDSNRPFDKLARLSYDMGEVQEFILGDDQPAQVLKIPPGVAHGLKVLQGPAVLSYITSREYDPADEGRIPYDALGYDWFGQDIR